MKQLYVRAAALAAIALLSAAPAGAATPAPSAPDHPSAAVPTLHLPNEPLHAELLVEVNKKGQVVRVKSGNGSKNGIFNTQTYGNALQMWIRKPDGSADVGLYKVTYDYDPKTKTVSRAISLVSLGGSWGDEEGAANAMINTAIREATDAYKQQEKERQSLPSLNEIRGASTPSPSPSPSPLPH